jgi:hypothetical protein
MAAETWDRLLERVQQWMILRFALNTERDLWVWVFIVGAAAHLEYLAFALLWIVDGRPTSFEQYHPKRTLSQAVRLIQKRNLLDSTTVEQLQEIAQLRNSVAHRGATYGVPFREGDQSRGDYKGRHVFTDPEGLSKLMDDVDSSTKVIGEWLQRARLGAGGESPA